MFFCKINKSKLLLVTMLITTALNSKHKVNIQEDSNLNIEKKIKQLEISIEKNKNELIKLEEELKKLKQKRVVTSTAKGTEIFYDLGSGVGKVTVQALEHDPVNPDKAKDIIADYYKDIRAEIPESEREMIARGKGSPVYGEILPDSFQQILEDKDLNVKTIKKAVGVELSPTRHHHAVTIESKLKTENLVPKDKTLEFKNENITETDISDATLIFMCSTCYPDELMDKLVERFSELKDGLRVISLKDMPDYEKFGFTEIKELKLPMTWSTGSPVHIYKLDKSNKKTTKKVEPKKEDTSKNIEDKNK